MAPSLALKRGLITLACLFPTVSSIDLAVSALTSTVESDWTSIYYPLSPSSGTPPLLLGNDGSAATGGWLAWDLNSPTTLTTVHAETRGRRTKLVTVVHRAGDGKNKKEKTKDLAISIGQPDSVLRAWTVPGFDEIKSARYTALGDWSALCSWKAASGNDYLYLFGKKQARVFLVGGEKKGDVTIIEVLTFAVPLEMSGCATSPSLGKMFLSADDDKKVYFFNLVESMTRPVLDTAGEAEDDVTGLAVYVSNTTGVDYLLIASESVVSVYGPPFNSLGELELVGLEDIEVQGLSVYQGALTNYPAGALVYAFEAEDTVGFGVSSLGGALQAVGLGLNTAYNPRIPPPGQVLQPICSSCSGNGYCAGGSGKSTTCRCFAGWKGKNCNKFTCEDNCSGNGQCTGPNTCRCKKSWGGLHCSFVLVEPVAETDANGGDGDDPAIWISPIDKSRSRIITTTKSTEGAGLGVFDLSGNLVQTIPAGEPNNVDIIYNFQFGTRTIDLAFAACREDDTLCLFEITRNGTLRPIPGGSQPVLPDFTVYGSCVYYSPANNAHYLFVNSKTSQYLQYELSFSASPSPSGSPTLTTTLVRTFFAGSGGQVEGCVTDAANGWIFIGEEPNALYRYDAEPGVPNPQGVAVATVGDGHLNADVEGVTLVHGVTKDKGYILVSTQGVSGYNVYKRKAPHEFVMTFGISSSKDGRVDAVSNTDGIVAVGTDLGGRFGRGLVVVHDDSNELPGGKGTSAEASFKLVSLGDVLGADVVKGLRLLDEVDADWDPRA